MAQVRPIFYPVSSCRILDPAVWTQILAAYGANFGNTVLNLAPADVATRWSAPLKNDPTSADYNNLPATFTSTAESMVLGHAVSSSVPGGTIGGVSYTDADGVLWTSVDWQWQIDFEDYTVPGGTAGNYTQEWVTWAGDGTVNRHITCTTNLTHGKSLLWIVPTSAGATRWMTWVTSDMIAAGKFAAYSASPASTTGGVTSVGVNYFAVKDDLGIDVSMNEVGVQYDALIINDTSNVIMATGDYQGTYNVVTTPTQTIRTTLPDAATITFLFIFGHTGTYVDTIHMPAGVSLVMTTANTVLNNGVTNVTGPGFTVGANNDVNDPTIHYYYAAFNLPAGHAIRLGLFDTWKIAGTGGGSDQVSGLGFTPGFALSRPYITGMTVPSRRRSPSETSTHSHETSNTNALDAAGGITAFGSGTITLGATTSPAATDIYGFAFQAGGTGVPIYANPNWTKPNPVPPDGHTTVIDYFPGDFPPDPRTGWTLQPPSGTQPQWWCEDELGESLFQIDSPGPSWHACSGPATLNGWYLSINDFGGNSIVTSAGRPGNPRAWADIVTWATGNRGVLGGSPGAACVLNNRLYFPASGYVVGTDGPLLHMFDGRKDNQLARIPPTTTNVVSKAVISMIAANGVIYFTTWDTGTSSADWTGRVFSLNPDTGEMLTLGTAFNAGELPYALAWHMGRLWCGTNNGIGTVGNVYYFRPEQDTAWTNDHSCAAGVDAMVSYGGKLYVGVDAAAGVRGKVLVRDTAAAYTTSQTGSGGTAVINNGYIALSVYQGNLYASYYNADAPVISRIEKYNGTSWSTVYTGVGSTLKPFILFGQDSDLLFAIGGSTGVTACILNTATGTSWTDLSAELPETTTTLLPMFGAVVM